MNETEKNRIREAWLAAPAVYRSAPASEEELQSFEQRYTTIPAGFRWFLAECGGGVVGSERVDGIAKLPQSHDKFRHEFGPPRGWTMEQVFIIGWDGGGNPFGIHTVTGAILVEDHDFGGIHEMAPSLYAFLLKGISD